MLLGRHELAFCQMTGGKALLVVGEILMHHSESIRADYSRKKQHTAVRNI